MGYESIVEIFTSRLGKYLGFDVVQYKLLYTAVTIDSYIYDVLAVASKEYCKIGEMSMPLCNYYALHKQPMQTPYAFCVENGWQAYLDNLFIFDFLIRNRDRHDKNIEVLKQGNNLRVSPIFDNGCSLVTGCVTLESLNFDVMEDIPVNNLVGSISLQRNLAKVSKPLKLPKIKRTTLESFVVDLLPYVPTEVFEKMFEIVLMRYDYLRKEGYIL